MSKQSRETAEYAAGLVIKGAATAAAAAAKVARAAKKRSK